MTHHRHGKIHDPHLRLEVFFKHRQQQRLASAVIANNNNRTGTSIDDPFALLQRLIYRSSREIVFHVWSGRERPGGQIEYLFVHDDFLSFRI